MPHPGTRIRIAFGTLAGLVAGVAFAAAVASEPPTAEPAPAGTSAVAMPPEAPAETTPAAAPAPRPRSVLVAPAATVTRPDRGALMSEVESRFGAPASRQAPVGQPPITRWDYPGLVVYFENERVIHSVVVRPED